MSNRRWQAFSDWSDGYDRYIRQEAHAGNCHCARCMAEFIEAQRLASVGRNPTGEDRADGLCRNDEHAVAATSGETPDPHLTPSKESDNA